MTTMTATVEFEPALYEWLKEYAKKQQLDFSFAMNRVLQLGIRVMNKELSPPTSLPQEIPLEQKLIIQCVMETLLILQDVHVSSGSYKTKIRDRAQQIIQKTLGLDSQPKPKDLISM